MTYLSPHSNTLSQHPLVTTHSLITHTFYITGDKDETTGKFSKFTFRGSKPCYPTSFPDLVVDSVDAKLRERLEDMELGMPLIDTMTVSEVLSGIMKYQGTLSYRLSTFRTESLIPTTMMT